MEYKFNPISIDDVFIIENWRYDGYMKSIFMKPYHDNLASLGVLKGPDLCDGFSVYVEKDLFGLFEYYHRDDFIEIGLAINPKYIKKGYSKSFIEAGISFAKKNYNYQKDYIYLTVEKENIAAYNAYKNADFVIVHEDALEIVMRRKV